MLTCFVSHYAIVGADRSSLNITYIYYLYIFNHLSPFYPLTHSYPTSMRTIYQVNRVLVEHLNLDLPMLAKLKENIANGSRTIDTLLPILKKFSQNEDINEDRRTNTTTIEKAEEEEEDESSALEELSADPSSSSPPTIAPANNNINNPSEDLSPETVADPSSGETTSKNQISRERTMLKMMRRCSISHNRSLNDLAKAVTAATFDHSKCSDCYTTYKFTCGVMMHLAAAQQLAEESTTRLQNLFKMKEKLREYAEMLESLDLWHHLGKHSQHHLHHLQHAHANPHTHH